MIEGNGVLTVTPARLIASLPFVIGVWAKAPDTTTSERLPRLGQLLLERTIEHRSHLVDKSAARSETMAATTISSPIIVTLQGGATA